jgi:hypothetical protein
MNRSYFLTKALPHVIAVVSFLAISIFMYRPIIFEGKVMDQNDINQGKGANQEIVEFREATGEEALWDKFHVWRDASLFDQHPLEWFQHH